MGIFSESGKDRIISERRLRVGRRLFAFSERIDFLRLGRFTRKRSRLAVVECSLKGQQHRRQIDGTVGAVAPFTRLGIAKPTWGKRNGPRVSSPRFRLEFIQPDSHTGPA